MKKLLIIIFLIFSVCLTHGQFTHSFPASKCVQCDYGDKAYPPSFNWPSPKANPSTSPKYMMVTGPPGAYFGDPNSTPTSISLVSTGEYGAPNTIFGSGDMYRFKVNKIESVSYRTEFYIGSGGGGDNSWEYSDTKWQMIGIYIPSDWCVDTRPMEIAFDMKYPDAGGPPSFYVGMKNGNFIVQQKYPQGGSENVTTLFPYEKGKWHYWLMHRNFTQNTNGGNVEGGTGGYIVLRYWKSGTTPAFSTVYSHFGPNYINYAPNPAKTEGYWLTGPYNWSWNNQSEGTGPCNTSLTLYYKHIFSANSTATVADFNNFISGAAAPGNQNPVASASAVDATIEYPGTSAVLDGTESTDADGSIVSYLWEKLAGGSVIFSDATAASPTVSGMSVGVYVFRLTVTDDDGATASDDVQVTVYGAAPSADAPRFTLPTGTGCAIATYGDDPTGCPSVPIPDQQIFSPATTDTATIYAVHGEGAGTVQVFAVALVSAPGGTSPTGGQYPPQDTWIPAEGHFAFAGMTANGNYDWEITVTDDLGNSTKDTFRIVRSALDVNEIPEVSAGPDKTIYVDDFGPNQVKYITLNGLSSDADDPDFTRTWSVATGPDNIAIANPDEDTTLVAGLVKGYYEFRLTAFDGHVSVSDLVAVNVIGVDAGEDQTISLPTTSVNLTATILNVSDTSDVTWSKISGTGGSFNNSHSTTPVFSSLSAGTYELELAVTYSDGNVARSRIKVVVLPAGVKKVYDVEVIIKP